MRLRAATKGRKGAANSPPSLARSPSRAAGYFSFGKSDTALPKALNFNSSRMDAALAHSTAHTIPHRPRRIETCETHVRLRRSPPFRARNGMEETGGRKSGSPHTLFGEGLQFFARDDRNHAAIICSKRKKSPRCNFPSLPGRPRPPSSSGNLLLSRFDEQNDITTSRRVIGAPSSATPFAARR